MSKRIKRSTLAQKRSRPQSAVALEELMFDSPESSTIKSGSYNPMSEMMTIHFGTGKTYDYDNFPLKLWKEFERAKSKGTYFALVIRPVYAGRIRA